MNVFDLQRLINKAKEEGKDVYKLYASMCFAVEYANVTEDQRSYAKAVLFGHLYSPNAIALRPDPNPETRH